jgi:hypothetical protein
VLLPLDPKPSDGALEPLPLRNPKDVNVHPSFEHVRELHLLSDQPVDELGLSLQVPSRHTDFKDDRFLLRQAHVSRDGGHHGCDPRRPVQGEVVEWLLVRLTDVRYRHVLAVLVPVEPQADDLGVRQSEHAGEVEQRLPEVGSLRPVVYSDDVGCPCLVAGESE